jgi:hypothetical protein
VGGSVGPDPASPIPGALPDLPAMHLVVEVFEALKGSATGTVVVHQSAQPGIEGCHGGVGGDSPVLEGQTLRFVAVQDEATGTYSLIAGPYSHEPAEDPLGAATPLITPYTTVPSAIPTATAAP